MLKFIKLTLFTLVLLVSGIFTSYAQTTDSFNLKVKGLAVKGNQILKP